MQTAGLTLVLAALSLLLGCPQPINNDDGSSVPADDPGLDISLQRSDETTENDGDDSALQFSTLPDISDDPVDDTAAAPEENVDGTAPQPDDDADLDSSGVAEEDAVDETDAVDPATADSANPETAGAEVAGVSSTEPVEEDSEFTEDTGDRRTDNEPETGDPQAALDAGRMLWQEEPGDPSAYDEPSSRVSRDSVAFAGDWTVAVVNQDGQARQTMHDDAWSFALEQDGQCSITQTVDGDEWSQRGGWELVGEQLTLKLGPGGQRSYTVSQPGDDQDVALLTDNATGALLFCLRIDLEAKSPKPAKRYDSDFGPISLYKSGMAYWAGSYGQPEGNLNFRMLGDYIVGTWEQQPGQGFMLLKLEGDSFNGWWWYEASTEFDGTWHGTAN